MDKLFFVVNDAAFFLSEPLQLARAARAQGYAVAVVAPAGVACAEIQAQGFGLHVIPLDRGGMAPVGEARTLAALLKLYRRERPAIVHHLGLKAILHGGLAARIFGRTHAVHALTGKGHLFTGRGFGLGVVRAGTLPVLRWVLGDPRALTLFLNPDHRQECLDAKLVTAERSAVVRTFGVDCERFRPSAEHAHPPLVVLPARLLWTKGVGEFVEAARTLQAAGVDARFALVGKPDPENPAAIAEAQLRAWVRDGAVEWWGHRADMPAVYAQAALVCLPSYSEGLPRVLLEAAASGRAIVTCDVAGCREVVRDGENGLLVPPRDPQALAGAIRQLVQDPERRRALGAAGRERAVHELTGAAGIAEILALYRKLLAA